MRLRPDCHVFFDLKVEQELIGVIVLAERAERWPLQIVVWLWSEIAVEQHFAVALRDAQFAIVRVEQFNAVLRTLGKRHAMPNLLMRTVLTRFSIATPTGHFKFGSARP